MLPTRMAVSSSSSSDVQFPDYFRRLLDFKQMDFESTFDQMIYLLSSDPESAFKSFYYRKQTKNQWARDDPAFVMTEGIFVAIGALAYAIAFLPVSIWGYLWSVLYCVLIDWLLVGVVIASVCCHISNKYLKSITSAHAAAQDVEWMYAFDVHCNAYICSYTITYVLQYILLPLLIHKGIISTVVANSLYVVAIVWYAYITHIGYKALPFLSNTQIYFWYSLVFTGVMWIFLVVLMVMGLQLNMSRIVMNFHYGG